MYSLLQIPKDRMCLVSQTGNVSLFRMTKNEIKIVSVKSQKNSAGKIPLSCMCEMDFTRTMHRAKQQAAENKLN